MDNETFNSDHHKNDIQNFDEIIAHYTDMLLDGSQQDQDETEVHEEIEGLKETINRLKQVIQENGPDQELSKRIHDRLVSEWRIQHPGEASRPKRITWSRLVRWLFPSRDDWQSSKQRDKILIVRFAFVLSAFLIIVLLVFPLIGEDLTATSVGLGGLSPLIIGVGFVVGLILLWWFSRER